MNELEKAKLLNAALELAKSEIRKSLKKINFVTEDGEKPKLIIVEQGERGPRGRDGQQGPIGESGLQGPQGERGEQGPQGKRGERGLIGPRGETGPEGPAGPMGPAGRDGRPSDLKPLEDKLKEDLQGFKQQISAQVTRLAMASLNGGGSSGGGEVRLLNLDDVDADVNAAGADGKALVWNNTTKKFVLGSVASGGGSGGISNTTFQAFVANTNNFITNIRQLERSALANTNARFANLTSRVVTLESGGGGTGDVSNTAFQSFIANTNAFIKSQLANTNTRIDNLVGNAHSTLDTLQELSIALANDANFLANTNARITAVDSQRASDLANTNARFANLTSRVVTLESGGGGGGGTGDVSNTAFQSFIANTNAFIKSQLANTNTRIDNVVVGSGGVSNTYLQTIVANTNARITNEGIFNGIIGGSNIRLSFSSGKLMIQSIPQVDFGFITNDAGNIGDPVDERRDFGDLGGRGL